MFITLIKTDSFWTNQVHVPELGSSRVENNAKVFFSDLVE